MNEPTDPKVPISVLLGERLSHILKHRDEGHETFTGIARRLGISPGRVADLYRKAKRLVEYHTSGFKDDPWYGLSVRVTNVMNNRNLRTKEAIRKAVLDGTLTPFPNGENSVRNYGWKSHVEVHKWLGLPEPQRYRRTVAACPHCNALLLVTGDRRVLPAGE